MNQERSTSHSPKTRPPLSSSSSNYFTSTSHQPSPSSSMASFTTARAESRHHTHTHTAPHNTSLSRFTTPAPTPTSHTPQCPPLRPSSTFYPQKQKQSDPAATTIPGAKGVRARKLEFEFELTPSPTLGGASSPPIPLNTTLLRPPIKLGTWEEEEEYKPQMPNENRLGSHVNVKVPRKA